MSWLGIGLISGSTTPIGNIENLFSTIPLLEPASQWTGVPGSGYESPPPADPVRTTAKPALRLLTPPFQHFTDTLDVGVIAAANDDGTLGPSLGIKEVTFHYEGNSVTVDAPRWLTIQTGRGPRSYFGWWVRLKKPAHASGTAQLYVEAEANDPTMQRRVIGPYLFSPVAQQYTHSIEIAPSQPVITGQRYQTLGPAISWLKSQASQNPLLTIAEPGVYDIGDSGTNAWDYTGYANITASVPGVTLGKTAFALGNDANLSPGRMKLHVFGANIAFDFRYVVQIATATAGDTHHWIDGIDCMDSGPQGKNGLWRGSYKNANKLFAGAPWFTEVNFTDVNVPAYEANLARGCIFERVGLDILTNARCAVMNVVESHDDIIWNNDTPAFTVVYDGPETVATIARRGGTEGFNLGGVGAGLYRVVIGSTTYDFDVGNGSEAHFLGTVGDGYWFRDVVAWLNTLPGITATTLLTEEDDRRACTGSLAGRKGLGWGFANHTPVQFQTPVSIKDTPLTVMSLFDKHGDLYQHSLGQLENVVFAWNLQKGAEVQCLFLSPTKDPQGNAAERDLMFFGNAMHVNEEGGTYWDNTVVASQFGRTDMIGSHVVVAHNTLSNQRWMMRSDNPGVQIDGYCLFKNNTSLGFSNGAGPYPNLTVDGLHLHAGAIIPSQASNVFAEGNASTLFADASDGNLAPAGPLLTRGFAPAIPFDLNRLPFPAFAALGAVAAEAPEYIPPPPPLPSEDPLADLLALINAAGGYSSVHDYATAAVSGGVWQSTDLGSNARHHTQATAARQPAISGAGATFDGNDQVEQVIAGGTFTIVMRLSKADANTNSTIITNQADTILVRAIQAGAGNFGGALVDVNGALVTTQGELFTAMHLAGTVTVTVRNLNLAAATALRFGRSSGGLVGTIRRVVVLDHAALGASLDEAMTRARQFAES